MRLLNSMRPLVPLWQVSIALVATIFAMGNVAATTCLPIPRTVEDALDRFNSADLVILGRVEEIQCRRWADAGDIRGEVSVRVLVTEEFKGADPGTHITIMTDVCSFHTSHFSVQDTFLILGYRLTENGRMYTGECDYFRYETANELTHGKNTELKQATGFFLNVLRTIE